MGFFKRGVQVSLLLIGSLFSCCSLFSEEIDPLPGIITSLDIKVPEELKIPKAPTVPDISSLTDTGFRWQLTQAQNALQAGLPTIAKTLCQQLESTWDGKDQEIPRNLSLCHIDSLIALGNSEQALELLKSRTLNSSERSLRLALIHERKYETAEARELLNGVRLIDLKKGDGFWYYLLQAFVSEEAEQEETKEDYIRQAKSSIVSPMQKILWDTFFLYRLQDGQSITEELLEELKEKTIRFSGGQLGFQYARQYALLLEHAGHTEEAIQVADTQLQTLHGTGTDEEDMFRLLIGVLAGPDKTQGAENLRKLIASGKKKEWQSLALYLLAQSGIREENRADFSSFISILIDRKEEHPLLDTLLYLRAQIAQLNGDKKQAVEYANRLLEQFPGSPLLKQTLYLLARNSWEESSSNLRNTAEYLLRYRDLTDSPQNRALIQILLGDVYFLNQDYSASRNSYSAAIREFQDPDMRGLALFQLTQTYLATNDLAEAINALEQEEENLSIEWRWRIHWNLLLSMRQKGMQREAFQRINLLLSRENLPTRPQLPASLLLRFQWLKADLSLIDQRPDETLAQTTQLLKSLEQSQGELDDNTAQRLWGHTLLVRAQAYYQEGMFSLAMDTLEQIQQSNSGEELTILSLLLKARFFESKKQLIEAQSTLQKVADQFPQSTYAPLALFEAAIKAEQRGLPNSFEQAISLLERIVRNYPELYQLRFQARLRQGEILRKMNQFSSAVEVYRSLMQQAQNDLEQYTAQLHLAYCLIALGNLNEQHFHEAQSYLEKIRQIRSLPADLRAEASYQEGFTLRQLKENKQATEVLGALVNEWFRSVQSEKDDFGPTGRYWALRATLELADMLEEQQAYEEALRLYSYLNELEISGISAIIHSRTERIKKSSLRQENTP